MDACPKCTHLCVVKAEKARGTQRWLCRGCGYQFTRSTRRGRPPWQKSLAVFLYCHGISMNALTKMFGVWASTVLTWIRRYTAAHAEKPAPSGKAIVLEIDEMWHFLKKNWIGKALDRDTGHLLDGECGRRDAATLKKLVDCLARWDVVFYCTDHWPVHAAVIPSERLVMSKAYTAASERNHGRQRHWFGRFNRRSIIVSNSKDSGTYLEIRTLVCRS